MRPSWWVVIPLWLVAAATLTMLAFQMRQEFAYPVNMGALVAPSARATPKGGSDI